MTPEQIAELDALAEKATPGPWQHHLSHVYGPDPERELVCQFLNGPWLVSDRDLTIALRNNLPAILAALKAQQPGEDVVERVARALAPHVCRPVHNGDCDDVAAGQDRARCVARAAIAAMQESYDANQV